MKAADFGTQTKTASALVSTNSVNQGQQVPILWQPIFDTGHRIIFAHTSFKWSNLASHNAGVTVVIVGISNNISTRPRIFCDTGDQGLIVRDADNINGYLISGPSSFIHARSTPPDERSNIQFGNHTYYGVDLLMTCTEAQKIIDEYPKAKRYIRRFLGAKEVTSGAPRACIWVYDKDAADASSIPPIKARIDKVAAARSNAKNDKSAQSLAKTPHKFREQFEAKSHTIVVPAITSENRPVLPVELATQESILGHKCYALYDAPLWNLALIASRLHWVWIGTVCVRMRTDFSYSNTLGWNTFPVPKLTEANKADLTRCAEDILLAREAHFPATIADLYDPESMPDNLRAAHERNDETLERIYLGRRFKNDTERLEKLFSLYTEMTSKPGGGPKKPATRKPR